MVSHNAAIRLLASVTILLTASNACGGSDDAASPTSTTTTSSDQTETDDGPKIEIVRDMPYLDLTDAPAEWMNHIVDVYAPATGGPHPVVVLYHADPAANNSKATVAGLASRLANAGAVVFAPTYGLSGHTAEALRYY
ncbi:MAG: hypothetical protein GY720_10770, partial [bacterium]|nr:hypothetical protein [bacterium]